MSQENIAEREHAKKALSKLKESFDIIFDRAPVMMHSIDKGGRLVTVNSRWLQTLGYRRVEVLGRKSIDFLTEESRTWAVKETLPLFWRVGSARSIGYQFVKKNGRVLDVLIDAEVSPVTVGNLSAYAALRDGYDLTQWEQASTTIRVLQELARAQRKLKSVLSPKESDKRGADALAEQDSSGQALEAGMASEFLGTLLELAQDISVNLRGLLRVQEQWLGARAEQQHELLLVAKSIDKNLTDLTDTAAHWRSN